MYIYIYIYILSLLIEKYVCYHSLQFILYYLKIAVTHMKLLVVTMCL